MNAKQSREVYGKCLEHLTCTANAYKRKCLKIKKLNQMRYIEKRIKELEMKQGDVMIALMNYEDKLEEEDSSILNNHIIEGYKTTLIELKARIDELKELRIEVAMHLSSIFTKENLREQAWKDHCSFVKKNIGIYPWEI